MEPEVNKEETLPVEGEQQPQAKEPEAPQLSEIEQKAMEQGWVPKEEWAGDPKDWRPADVFIDRGELLGKIKSQSTELREVKAMIGYLSDQNRKLYEAGYEKAINDLQELRDTAIEQGDAKTVRQLDRQIQDHEKALSEVKNAPKPTVGPRENPQEVFQNWLTSNKWYKEDEVLQYAANGLAINYKAKNPEASDEEVLRHIGNQIRRDFPDKFKRVGAPSPDGASRRGGGSPPKNTGSNDFDAIIASLPEAEAQVAMNLVKRNHITKEEFVKNYKQVQRSA